MTTYEIYCEVRDKYGYKDSYVAQCTGITKSTFSDWKSGRYTPKQDKIQKIADFLGVTVEYLMTGQAQTAQFVPDMPCPLEWEIIKAFRRADSGTQAAVMKLLDVEIAENKKDSSVSA